MESMYINDQAESRWFRLILYFRIPKQTESLVLYHPSRRAIEYEFSAVDKDEKLVLSAAEAKAFTITMTSYIWHTKKRRNEKFYTIQERQISYADITFVFHSFSPEKVQRILSC